MPPRGGSTEMRMAALKLFRDCLRSARRIPASEQRGIWLAYARGKFREGTRLADPCMQGRALEEGKEQLHRMNYFHAVREKKEELERAAAVAAREQHQQQQPPPADWRRRPQGRLPHQTDGPAAAVATTGEREKWDLSAFLHRSLPGVAEAELARYEAGLRAEGFGDGCGGLLVHLREGDLAQWKKAHARAFLAAVRREVGGDAEGGKS